MSIFTKKETVYISKGTKAEWKQLRAALKEAGIRPSASSYEDEMPVGGCGAKMDIRDFGPNGKIDRSVYVIRVPEGESTRAKDVVRETLPDYVPYEYVGLYR